MKTCPFCAEEIKDEAIRCRYCQADLHTAKNTDRTHGTAEYRPVALWPHLHAAPWGGLILTLLALIFATSGGRTASAICAALFTGAVICELYVLDAFRRVLNATTERQLKDAANGLFVATMLVCATPVLLLMLHRFDTARLLVWAIIGPIYIIRTFIACSAMMKAPALNRSGLYLLLGIVGCGWLACFSLARFTATRAAELAPS